MSIPLFLAATAQEIRQIATFPPKIGWMSCHFSPSGSSLTDLPRTLPPDPMLILDDRIPATIHEPKLVAAQLAQVVEELKCSHVLLDWQRPPTQKTEEILGEILLRLPCPTAVTEAYVHGKSCAVFLPPVPPHIPVQTYLMPWQGREIWLEAALDGSTATVTPEGCTFEPVPYPTPQGPEHFSQELHCHYGAVVSHDKIRFQLRRTPEDLTGLLSACEDLGVSLAVGLYQELI